MDLTIVYILISVVGGAVGQVMLKKGMDNMGPLTLTLVSLPGLVWRIVTNPYVFFGLAVYGAGTLFWLVAISRVGLSYAYPFVSLSYVIMLAAAFMLFHEEIPLLRIIGTAVICIGVILISRS
jgi:drug/metabolite transporter (DMT)-like permease